MSTASSRHMRRRVRGGHPSRSLLFRAVLRDRLTQQSPDTPGAPATVHHDLEPSVQRPAAGGGHGADRIEVGHGLATRRATESPNADDASAARRSIGELRSAGSMDMPLVWTAWCCRHVCGFRYADDMSRLVASRVYACVDRRGRAIIWQKPSAMACAWKRSPPTSPVTVTPRWNC